MRKIILPRTSIQIISLSSFIFLFVFPQSSCTQPLNKKAVFTHQDTLRGSITPARSWWDVTYYHIYVTPDYEKKSISGFTQINFKVLKAATKMQLDLQKPMEITSITWKNIKLPYSRDGNAYFVNFPEPPKPGSVETILVSVQGTPVEAVRPPWEGGWIWSKDQKGRPWMSVACQGLGASVWYPCKDHQSDEPDSAAMTITVPDTLVAVSNGRLREKISNGNNTATYTWAVVNPINNYDLVPYIGKYVTWNEAYNGEKGKLDCFYWVLDYNLEKGKEQFKQVPKMLKCFEHWFGPYPFYEDGYKLIEAPHLGMEHQSAIAYGNKFINGYAGSDHSGSGWGLKWDFIIVHESAHEWFGNNITTKDIADMWVHESFANYAEALFVDCEYRKEAASDYVAGNRKNIRNDKTIIGIYDVNQEGSGDMYPKGGNLLHLIRQIINDDEKFRKILRGLNKDFYHQTVTTKQIENYFSEKSRINLSKVFDQYLRTTQVPALEYYFIADKNDHSKLRLYFRWIDCVKGFNMPIRIFLTKTKEQSIRPIDEEWNYIATSLKTPVDPDQLPDIRNRNYYIRWIENRKIVPPGKFIKD